ncbi:bifunctional UDP-N-acetylglucosamine diphosphorylase/glucosamine-1-phosphate N-acetyltransferase GlmU [Methylocapsa aurea]|uniref:bifunctional UDP-N-acetylglucosamine diphosphorylase/glucosamine-1-phosphate N-acetyltransferase GlmU n=1 Tax=Methylocapsa aurea TaxID=663610 RepID=UPI0005661842|nr:bifunctional UDP-N-acetylglucosamine diphosphorylase/glucosamine-1-phosphate N-acetyltransferase GlmU [Methylocapsa aurea]
MPPADSHSRSCLAIVLGAGEGSRMGSAQPKVLHKLAGRSMLAHVLTAVLKAGADRIVVVAGPDHESVIAEAKAIAPGAEIAIQEKRLGTAHAVLAARKAIAEGYDDILVVFADTPLVRPQTFARMREALADGKNAIAALGFEAQDPSGYGRFIVESGTLIAIREDRDASPAERAVRLCNAGLMALAGQSALALLEAIGNANSKGEYYLTDCIALARAKGLQASALSVAEDEVLGVNDRMQLAAAEAILQGRLRAKAMLEGATLIDPSSVTLSFDTALGRDVIVEPHVVFGPGVSVGEGSLIRSFSHLEGASVGAHATIGPFARLRPGAELGPEVHIGNFVEVKATQVGAGAKINHLSYIGDASIGARTNIGAGTITCNYDGFAKFRTEIGENAFVGSNSALVAPVRIGAGAYIGSGSVITQDIAPDALALARARQVEKPGWAKAHREKNRK